MASLTEFSKREMKYAAVALPIAASAIITDSTDIDVQTITFDSAGYPVPAYVAIPSANKRAPVVLVVQEIFGVHEHIRAVCRRLAHEGYCAIAPELYARQGNVANVTDIQEIINKVVRKVPDAQVLSDLDAAVEYVRSSGKGDTTKLGIVGFCWGGRIVWLYSAHQAELRAGAAWYGKLAAGPYSSPSMQPRQPLDVAGELNGAILGLYGGKDEGIPLSDVARMREAIASVGKSNQNQIIVYPEAGHAFFADYRPSYHELSAKDAWKKMLAWFQKFDLAA
jgi:carboxymethylenebutenolidase